MCAPQLIDIKEEEVWSVAWRLHISWDDPEMDVKRRVPLTSIPHEMVTRRGQGL
jgi:hypothetical protein